MSRESLGNCLSLRARFIPTKFQLEGDMDNNYKQQEGTCWNMAVGAVIQKQSLGKEALDHKETSHGTISIVKNRGVGGSPIALAWQF